MSRQPIRITRKAGYPHLISLGLARNTRWPIEISNTPIPQALRQVYSYHSRDAVDAHGDVTTAGRRLILDHLCKVSLTSKSVQCVVWSATSCTFIMKDGTTVEGYRPPEGSPVEPAEYEAVNDKILNLRYLKLPEGCPWPYVCIRSLDADHIEVSAGGPIVLGEFDELPTEGPGSELRRYLDADGKVIQPKTFRGVQTTGVGNGYELLGPVQPYGWSVHVVAPWPQEIFAACEAVAARKLPANLLQAAWRAVEPVERGMVLVGALEAA